MNEKDKMKEKLELLSALKEDETANQEKQRKNENTLKKLKSAEVLEEIKKVKETTPKKKKNIVLTVIAFIALVTSLTYLIYNIVKASNQVNQPYLIINSVCLFVIILFLVITSFTTKKSMQKKLNILNVAVVTIYTLFQFLVTSQVLTLPTLKTIGDFSNVSINEVIKWANDNKITLEQTYEYSDIVESDHVISQSVPAETLLKDIKKLEVIVSNGPNYESIVSVPNMIGWNVDDVVKKIKELKLSNVTIEYNFSEVIEKDIAYEQSKSGEIRRNEALILKFSLGKEADLKPVNLTDLSNQEEFDAVLWLKRNGIRYEISYEFDNDIESGKVIATLPDKGTLIDQKETTVKLVISKGPKITAPDLTKMSLEEITEWAIKNKLILVYDSEYNSEIKAGDIIRVSVKEGDILEENQRIYIITSRGTLKMISYTDGDIAALRSFAAANNLTLTESQDFSDTIEKGKFINVSKKPGEAVNSGEEITVNISLGKSTVVPNFIGMNASKAKSTCTSSGLTCSMSYVYSSNTKGNVFNQSMTAGSKVIGGTNIVLTISNGPKPNNSTGSSTNNSGSNNSGNTNQSTTPSCEEKALGNLVIQESWLVPGNSNKTISSLQTQLNSKYPGAKFNFVLKDHNSMNSGLIHPSSPTNAGTPIRSCQTYTIYIVE